MSDYSPASKVLHYMALNSPLMGEMAFDIEQNLFLKSSPRPESERHVFVSGLARAGTTILMREIHKSGQFASLTYADMPFVLCPNLWGKIHSRSAKTRTAQERAHGDGILVDFDSPEAFEEVFWRVFTKGDYIKDTGLHPHNLNKEILDNFRNYILLILSNQKKTRYLSKNNNNVLRIPALRKGFPGSVFLIPIRSPLAHSSSLLVQHRRFLEGDDFTRKYMGWLAHHEFGATHKPFVLSPAGHEFENTLGLDYWLEQWFRYYSYLDQVLGEDAKGIYFVPYESLCESASVWDKIAGIIGVDGLGETEFRKSERPLEEIPDEQLAHKAENLYFKIKEQALEVLGVDIA